ncbi:hypothetical protein C8Q80DRAFT_1276351 [Daedaleopsis nitida]|nr:hypothetical protein C8Q80DRAFT_1276351 [Daedaleopsis nitida]
MSSECIPEWRIINSFGKFEPTIVPTFLEVLFTGLLIAAFCATVYLRTRQPPEIRRRHRIVARINTAIFILSLHLALSLERSFSVYMFGSDMRDMEYAVSPGYEGNSIGAYDSARLAIYLVWRKWTVLIVPVLSTIADIVSGYVGVVAPFTFLVFFWTSWLTATLCSALIFGRLVKSGRRVVDALVRSSAIYPAILIFPVVVFLFPHIWIAYIILAPPIVATMSSLIVMQLSWEAAEEHAKGVVVKEASARAFHRMDDVDAEARQRR